MPFLITEACITTRQGIRVSDRIQCTISLHRNTSWSILFIPCFSTVYKQFALQQKLIHGKQVNYSSNSITRQWNCRCSHKRNSRRHLQTKICCMHLFIYACMTPSSNTSVGKLSPARSRKQSPKDFFPLYSKCRSF